MTSATRTLVMTGGTSGIGRCAIEQLLAEHTQWRIFLFARPSPHADALQAMHASGERLRIIPADLSSLRSVEAACGEIRRLLPGAGIDALALNAGVQELDGDRASADGFELSFAVNHLAHFAIAEHLVPSVRPGGRVVITASEVHDPDAFCLVGIARAIWQDPLELADPKLSQAGIAQGVERGEARYSISKLMNVMHARVLAREAPQLRVVSFHPGVVPGTEIARERNLVQRLIWRHLMRPLSPILPGARSMHRSAGDLIWLLTEANLDSLSGDYFDGRNRAPGSAESRDPSKIARMLVVSRALLADSRRRSATGPVDGRRAAG